VNIAYMMSRFPHLPETFILREMIWVEKSGWPISLYPLICQEQPVLHKEAEAWLQRAKCYPYLSAEIFRMNMKMFVRNPLKFLSTWGQVVLGNIASPKFLLRALVLFPKIVTIATKMEQEGVSHIHAHYATHPALAGWIIHQLTGISYSITVHAHDIYVDRPMLGPKLKAALFVVAISRYNQDFLAREVGEWVRKKTHVVHCGIDPQLYSQPQETQAEGHPFRILAIGSLQPYKGFQYLIEACALLKIPFICQIIGGGELHAALTNLIQQNNLQDRVKLLGAKTQQEVAQLLAQADCYVQPSVIQPNGKMEGIPVALMEAMAYGLPVIATKISGIPELVQPGKSGTLVPERSAVDLAEAITQVFNHPETAKPMAAAGRQLVLSEFNLNTTCAELSNLFHQYLTPAVPATGA
jgi:glycosyltransferase involved in cell wall biosynthesis